ncbi:hypothetical protein [Vibrio antiquarius]|uniref:hypothetical protein n=1 Tax=Vibrio antiquarius (strain Ex25) TaxID=150340 RepID=UPI0026595E9E|nr:hypothetical protein [Vibrio antiquarius]MCR9966070.1 hypothetical protein [Vibrio antiquarius]
MDLKEAYKHMESNIKGLSWKRIGIHMFVNVEKYQLIVIGFIALLWNVYSNQNWPEPLIALLTVIFAALALKKIIIKGNVDDDLERIVSRSDPISDWYSNEQYSENEHVSVYRKDPALVIYLFHDPVNSDFKEPWINKLFPDPKVTSHRVSIRYSGGELFNKIILNVDGGRIYLPLPQSKITLETTPFDLAICQILNGQTGYDTAYYFKRTKMVISKEKLEKNTK